MNAATICDHVNAFVRYSRNDIYVYPKAGSLPGVHLEHFDVIVVHYSIALGLDSYISEADRVRISRFPGLKIAFIQDEYRWVSQTVAALTRLGIGVVFTCVPEHKVATVYGPELAGKIRFVSNLTGYVPHWLLNYEPKPLAERRLDVGYRGREYPAWLGDSAREKVLIGRRFRADARYYGLRTNIGWRERDRLYGAEWVHFQRNCRAVLSTETGIDVLDKDGTLSARAGTYETLRSVRGSGGALRRPDYDDVKRRYVPETREALDAQQLSPRTLEAAALRTGLIMYEGAYSGYFLPWEHFIPLRKDHGNMPEVVAALRSDERLAELVANAFALVSTDLSLSYKALMAKFDKEIGPVDQLTWQSTLGAGIRPGEFNSLHGFTFIDNPHGVETRPPSVVRQTARRVRRGLKALLRSR